MPGRLRTLAGQLWPVELDGTDDNEGDAWRWWEKRRLAYNLFVIVTGTVGFLLYIVLYGAAERTGAAGSSDDGPFGLLGALVASPCLGIVGLAAANLLFTFGFGADALCSKIPAFTGLVSRRRIFKTGMVVTVLVLGLPAVVWGYICLRAATGR